MSSRPYVSSKVVCYALSLAQEARRRGEKTTLSEALKALTSESPRALPAAIREAIEKGLVMRGQSGYHLTAKGRLVAEQRDAGRPKR